MTHPADKNTQPACPHCGRTFNEWLRTIPEYKYISVDVPLDLVEVEWTEMIGLLYDWCRAFNRHVGGRLKFKVPPLKRMPDIEYK